LGCLLVLVGLTYGLTRWGLNTYAHEQNAAGQEQLVATIVDQRLHKELSGGALYQLPVSQESFVLDTVVQYSLRGVAETCLVRSAFSQEAKRTAFVRLGAGKIGHTRLIYRTHNPSGAVSCRFDRYPEIDATDWAVIGLAAAFVATLSALYVIATVRFLRKTDHVPNSR
jgi:hypothetical protein